MRFGDSTLGLLDDIAQDVPVLLVRLPLRAVQHSIGKLDAAGASVISPLSEVVDYCVCEILAHLVVEAPRPTLQCRCEQL